MNFDFNPPLEVKSKDGAVRKIASISLREPKAKEVVAAEKAFSAAAGPAALRVRDVALVAAVAGSDADVVGRMPISRFNEAVVFLREFLDDPGAAAEDHSSELELSLNPPIEKSGNHYDRLTLREPAAEDVEIAEREMNATMSAETVRRFQIVLISRVSGVPRFIIEELPITQLDAAARYLGGFIGAGRKAGSS